MISSKSTIIGGGRAKFAIFLICLVGGVELTLASRSCKNTVMKIVMKQCSNAELRSRRATDIGGKNDMWKSLVAGIFPTTVNGINKIVVDNLNIFLEKLLAVLKDSLTSMIMGRPNSISADERMRHRRAGPMNKGSSLPISRGDDLGFGLTGDEVDELYNEIFERPQRQPSTTPDKAKAVFLDIAAKCCQNEDKCLSEKIIDCP